jgi:hypothetical protein
MPSLMTSFSQTTANVAYLQYLAPVLWFVLSAVALYPLARLYVRLLCAVGERDGLARVVLGGLLWIAFSAIAVAPLFGWLALAQSRFPAFLAFPAAIWPVLCFCLCIVAINRAIKPSLRQLRSVGFFRKSV